MLDKNNLEEFQAKIDKKISLLENEEGRVQTAFPDGIINIDKYINSKVKILWILKEPNSTEDALDWRKSIGDLQTEVGIDKDFGKTFSSIVYVSKGIIYGKKWAEINWIVDEPELVQVLQEIAFINIKKIPGGSRAENSILEKYYQRDKEIIIEQIKNFKPNVIICGNIYSVIKNEIEELFKDLEYDEYIKSSDLGVSISKESDLIIFDARHPQNTSTSRDIYCSDIINKYIDIKNRNLLN